MSESDQSCQFTVKVDLSLVSELEVWLNCRQDEVWQHMKSKSLGMILSRC